MTEPIKPWEERVSEFYKVPGHEDAFLYNVAALAKDGEISELRDRIAELERMQSGEPVATVLCYITTVPDHHDRIIWRNAYYHLPPARQHMPSAQALYEGIREVLLNYRMTSLQEDEDGSHGYRLLDHLCGESKSLSVGKHEVDLICDEIFNQVLTDVTARHPMTGADVFALIPKAYEPYEADVWIEPTEMRAGYYEKVSRPFFCHVKFARAVEAHHGIKGVK